MPFANYASIGEVARAYQITLHDTDLVIPLERPPSEMLRQQLAFAEKFAAYNSSEWAVCEYLIHPVLHDVWKAYTGELMLSNSVDRRCFACRGLRERICFKLEHVSYHPEPGGSGRDGGMMLGSSSLWPPGPFKSWCLAWVVWPSPWILMNPSAAEASYWSPAS